MAFLRVYRGFLGVFSQIIPGFARKELDNTGVTNPEYL
jgi:hypothetical protein